MLENIAVFAIPQVELIAHDRPIHRVCAVDELAVDDGVGPEILRQFGRAARVPAAAMSCFRIHAAIVAEIQ